MQVEKSREYVRKNVAEALSIKRGFGTWGVRVMGTKRALDGLLQSSGEQQNQNDQDGDADQTEATAGCVSPVAAMRPCRQSADATEQK
jgi:hypothetical protein